MSNFRLRHVASTVAGLALLAGAAACSSSASSSGPGSSEPSSVSSVSSASSAAVGPTVVFHGLRLSGGYVPQPASPDVAAAYLTVDNTTGRAQRLTKVVTNVASAVMAMNETDNGGVGSMTELSRVVIPAHGTYRFVPNHAHLMLEKPRELTAGERVVMTLTFAPAGTVTVMLPVVPIGATPGQASMSPMQGMSMSGGS